MYPFIQCPLLKYADMPPISENAESSTATAPMTAQMRLILLKRSASISLPFRPAIFFPIRSTRGAGSRMIRSSV